MDTSEDEVARRAAWWVPRPRRHLTRVKLVEDLPAHAVFAHAKAGRHPYSGQWVTVQLPAVGPEAAEFKCDTEYLWEIPAKEVERLTGRLPSYRVFVCEHQIVTD